MTSFDPGPVAAERPSQTVLAHELVAVPLAHVTWLEASSTDELVRTDPAGAAVDRR